MRYSASIVAVLCLGIFVGCGQSEDPDATPVSFQAYFAQGECAQRTALGANLEATLEISGFEDHPCSLTVDPTSLQASGDCDNILVGYIKYLGLGYWYPNPADTSERALIAYQVGWVDLRAVPDDGVAEVNLGEDGAQIDTDAQKDALPTVPTSCDSEPDVNSTNLCLAKYWAQLRLTGALEEGKHVSAADFDRDLDTLSNLEEACSGSLF